MASYKMKPEQYFLRYACSCATVLKDLGRIGQEKVDKIQECALKNETMSREELESTFTEAFRRIKKIAAEMHKDYWDMEVLKEYFLRGKHNEEIDAGDGFYAKAPKVFKELCKVHKAKIMEKKGNVLRVKIGDKERIVISDLVPEAKVGDTVTVHYGFAVEKI